MNKWTMLAVAALASGMVQFGLLVGTGVTEPLPLAAGVIGATGASVLALLKQLPRDEWPPSQRLDMQSRNADGSTKEKT